MPPLSDEQYAALRADIEARGVVVPVVVDQHGRTIDGHNRQEIASDLGVDCPTEVRHVTDDAESATLAVTLNVARRHLSRDEKRTLIRAEIARCPDDSDRAIARRVGVDHKTVGTVRRVGESPHLATVLGRLSEVALTLREAAEQLQATDITEEFVESVRPSLARIDNVWDWIKTAIDSQSTSMDAGLEALLNEDPEG